VVLVQQIKGRKMDNIKVELLLHTPLEIMINAIRISHRSEYRKDTTGNSLGPNDKALISVILKNGHLSVLEHINYTFKIEGLPRGILLELERHRIGVSITVESTRWTLRKLFKDEDDCVEKLHWLTEYISEKELKDYCEFLKSKINIYKNDIAKLFLLESYPSNFIMTINARALRHMFDLRLDRSAHFIFRELMRKIRDVLPYSHIILYKDI